MNCNQWIFDMDGTLTDSMTAVWENAPLALLRRYGRTPRADLRSTLLSMGMADGAHPHTLFGYGEVREYQADEVPFFLLRLRALFPELYEAVVEADPKQGEKTPNFVGKRAKLLTLKTNCEYRSKNYGTFFFDGKYAIFDDYRTAFRPFDGGK